MHKKQACAVIRLNIVVKSTGLSYFPYMPADKSAYLEISFIISQPKHMLLVCLFDLILYVQSTIFQL